MRAAGFWRRGAAWSLDALPIAGLALALCWNPLRAAATSTVTAWTALADTTARHMAAAIMASGTGTPSGADQVAAMLQDTMHDPALLAAAGGLQSALLALAGLPLAVFVALFLAWCVGFERSALRATPGKRALGLRVVAADGGIAGAGTLLLRFLAAGLSWLSLNLGHLMAALPPRHAALHDRISRTRVVLDTGAPAPMPAWAIAWMAVLATASLVACAWLAAIAATSLRAALDRALWG